MSIATNLQRLVNAKSDIADAITAKGGTVNSGDGFEEFPADIATIPSGGGSVDYQPFKPSTIPVQTSKIAPIQYTQRTASVKQWYSDAAVDYINPNIWTDGTDTYYSSSNIQCVLDKNDYRWHNKVWNGLTSFNGEYIWSDGNNIYYSNGSAQYVLNRSTSTWSTKSWNGLTSFNGKCIWSDGNNIYYSNGSEQYVLNKSTSTWSAKTWIAGTDVTISNIYGTQIWTDGTDIYYSRYEYDAEKQTTINYQYVLDKATSTWTWKTWSMGAVAIWLNGVDVWTDGEYIYHSRYMGAYTYAYRTHRLDKSTSRWVDISSAMNLTYGRYVWSDGNQLFAPLQGGGLGLFDSQAITFSPVTFYKNSVYNTLWGYRIWNDGDVIYYSAGTVQKVLNKSTSIWSNVTWNGLTSFNGEYIWSDGNNIYYSNGSEQYILDKSTRTWTQKTWIGLTSFDGNCVWTDGDDIYYSGGSSSSAQFVLNKATSTWSQKLWYGINSYSQLYGYYIMRCDDKIIHSYTTGSTNIYELDKSTSTWTKVSTTRGVNPRYCFSDGVNIYQYNTDMSIISTTPYINAGAYWQSSEVQAFFGTSKKLYGTSNSVWSDGEHLYYSGYDPNSTSSSYNRGQYELPKVIIGEQS